MRFRVGCTAGAIILWTDSAATWLKAKKNISRIKKDRGKKKDWRQMVIVWYQSERISLLILLLAVVARFVALRPSIPRISRRSF